MLISSKKINEVILVFAIILLIFSLLIFCAFFINKKNSLYRGIIIVSLHIFSFILTFINWPISIAILAKVNKIRKKNGNKLGVTNEIKTRIIYTILIITFELIIYFIQFLYIKLIMTIFIKKLS